MKQAGSLSKLLALAVGLGVFVAVWSAQAKPGKVVVRAVIGKADYTQEGVKWRSLGQGQVLRQGAMIRTYPASHVDLFLGVNGPFVRIMESTELGIDDLSYERTGVETVIETSLDLRVGRVLGNVKKMAVASRYEVKTPNGVAGIRGTKYDISTITGQVRVLEDLLIWVWKDPTTPTLPPKSFNIPANMMFDPITKNVVPIPQAIIREVNRIFTRIPIIEAEMPVPQVVVEQEDIIRNAIPPSPYDSESSSSSAEGEGEGEGEYEEPNGINNGGEPQD